MIKQPIPFTPAQVRVLAQCPLHFHFLQQSPPPQPNALDTTVYEAIQRLHAAGGPARLSLDAWLETTAGWPQAQAILAPYYRRLAQDWPRMIAGHESMTLKISLGGVALLMEAVIDRLDKTSDGGILAILFHMESGPLPEPTDLRQNHAITIYHALAAAAYPLKRPVRIQEWWLSADDTVTVELSEDEYRHNLSQLRAPLQALARGEVMARPGLHCDTCPFKHRGCPVYSHEPAPQDTPNDFVPKPPRGKIHPREWIFKI
jgi:hypothetical protein